MSPDTRFPGLGSIDIGFKGQGTFRADASRNEHAVVRSGNGLGDHGAGGIGKADQNDGDGDIGIQNYGGPACGAWGMSRLSLQRGASLHYILRR